MLATQKLGSIPKKMKRDRKSTADLKDSSAKSQPKPAKVAADTISSPPKASKGKRRKEDVVVVEE